MQYVVLSCSFKNPEVLTNRLNTVVEISRVLKETISILHSHSDVMLYVFVACAAAQSIT
jgi:hypothetical protein